MGEYYEFYNFDKKEYITPTVFNCGDKLSQCTYFNNDYLNCVYTLMNNEWKNDFVLFLGDETRITSKGNPILQDIIDKYGDYPQDDFWENGRDISCLFKAAEKESFGEKGYYDPEEEIKYTHYINYVYNAKPFTKDFTFYRYIYNHDKKQYIDRMFLKEYDGQLHLDPFPQLIGICYRGTYEYPDFEKYFGGMWIGDNIEITNEDRHLDYEDITFIDEEYNLKPQYTKQECEEMFLKTINSIFGKDYLESYKNCIVYSCTIKPYNNKYSFFMAIDKEFPGLKASKKGWQVYAIVDVNQMTGEVTLVEYQTELFRNYDE